jgi:ribose transport system permease protein
MTSRADHSPGGQAPAEGDRGPELAAEQISVSGRTRRRLRHAPQAAMVALVDVLLLIGFSVFSPGHAFFHVSNFQDMALDSSQIVLLTVGVAFLLGAAELDISLGANVIMSSIIGSKVLLIVAGNQSQEVVGHYPRFAAGVAAGVLSCLLAGAAVGLVNGLVVTRLGVNSFITTLGMTGILTGIALVVTNGANVPNLPGSLQQNFGVKNVFLVPEPALVSAGVIAFLWWVFVKTGFGVRVRAIGSSREAATRAGLPVKRQILLLFVLAGLLAGLCGCLDVSRFATTDVSGHLTDSLAAIAGAVIGGTSMFGGRVSVGGAICGALLAEILQTGLVIMGLPSYYQQVVIGVILITAVALRQRTLLKGQSATVQRRPKRAGS